MGECPLNGQNLQDGSPPGVTFYLVSFLPLTHFLALTSISFIFLFTLALALDQLLPDQVGECRLVGLNKK